MSYRKDRPLPRAIRAWRRRLGWTQEQAAKELGVSRRSYSSWENGERMPRKAVLLAMSALQLNARPLGGK